MRNILEMNRPALQHGRLKTSGTKIVDERGQPFVLRGVSLFWSQWMPQFYNAELVEWLAHDWRINAIRAAVGVHKGGYIENPDAEFQRASVIIEAAQKAGIYVIVDWHSHLPEIEAAAEFFDRLAKKYADCPHLIFELWNEPARSFSWLQDIKPYHEAILPVIRKYCPDNLVILGTENYSQRVDVAASDPISDNNIAYTLHFYAASHRQGLRQRIERAIDNGIAILVTEYGVCEASGDGNIDKNEVECWWDFLNTKGLGYINWAISDKAESSAALVPGSPHNGNWDTTCLTRSGQMIRDHIRTMNLTATDVRSGLTV